MTRGGNHHLVSERAQKNLARLLVIATLMPALLAGCATYRSQSLSGSDIESTLRSPDRAALVREAAQLSHPRLHPVALDFSRALTPEQVAVIAVLMNPDLRALRAQQGVAKAQVFAAGLLPDPQFTAGIDKPLAPAGFFSAVSGALGFDVGAIGVRGADRAVAIEAERQVRLDVVWQEWLTAGQARTLAERMQRLDRLVALAAEARHLADRALTRALRAAERRDLRADELQARRISASDATDRALGAERDFAAARLDLNRVLGLPPDEALAVRVAGGSPAAPFDADELFAAARTQRLDLQSLAAGFESQNAAVHRAVLGQFPRLSVTLTRARDTSKVQTFGPAVTLDLPLWNRNRGAIRVTEADRDRLREEYVARLHATRAEIAALVSGLRIAVEQRDRLLEQLPGLRAISANYARATARDDVSGTVADGVRATLLDKEIQLETLRLQIAEQLVGLELAVGAPLGSLQR